MSARTQHAAVTESASQASAFAPPATRGRCVQTVRCCDVLICLSFCYYAYTINIDVILLEDE